VCPVRYTTCGEIVDSAKAIEREVAELFREYAAGLIRYGLILAPDRTSAQDAVQEVFLRYFTARVDGQPINNPRAWLYRVLRNHLFDVQRRAERSGEVGLEDVQDRADEHANPETTYTQDERVRQFWRLLAPRELECMRLRTEGLSYSEIARVMDLRPGTIAALLSRAHRKMRSLLETERRRRGRRALVKETRYAP